jgi:hypothetical protein
MRRIDHDDIDHDCYTNVGIMIGDVQASVPETAVLGGEFKTGFTFLARAGGGLLWICSLPCPGWQEARAGQAPQGLRLAGVLEVVEEWDRSTYRAVYTVRFEGVVFVLHMLPKKSKRGAATPKADIDLIRERLKVAEQIAKELTR